MTLEAEILTAKLALENEHREKAHALKLVELEGIITSDRVAHKQELASRISAEQRAIKNHGSTKQWLYGLLSIFSCFVALTCVQARVVLRLHDLVTPSVVDGKVQPVTMLDLPRVLHTYSLSDGFIGNEAPWVASRLNAAALQEGLKSELHAQKDKEEQARTPLHPVDSSALSLQHPAFPKPCACRQAEHLYFAVLDHIAVSCPPLLAVPHRAWISNYPVVPRA